MIYAAFADPYCYFGSDVLKNIPGLRDPVELERFEAISFALRSEEPLPAGRLSVPHYLAVHRHLFQDVYRWAGRPRTIRIFKGGNAFCYPENIQSELKNLFQWLRSERFLHGLDEKAFVAGLAHFLAELNAIHPFKEGNGRAQSAFAMIAAIQADHPLNMEALEPGAFREAMIISFSGNEKPLADQLHSLL